MCAEDELDRDLSRRSCVLKWRTREIGPLDDPIAGSVLGQTPMPSLSGGGLASRGFLSPGAGCAARMDSPIRTFAARAAQVFAFSWGGNDNCQTLPAPGPIRVY